MVQEVKRLMDTKGFDYTMKVLAMLQAIALGVLVPVLMGMSAQLHQQNVEFREFRARVEERMSSQTLPVRVEILEKQLRELKLEFVKHLASCSRNDGGQ